MGSSAEEEPVGTEWRTRPWLWIWIAVGMVVLFFVVAVSHVIGFAHIDIADEPFSKWNASKTVLYYALDAVVGYDTSILFIALMTWTAVVGRFERDRLMLVVSVFLTALLLRSPISAIFGSATHAIESIYRFPNTTALYATITYGGLVFVFDRSAIRTDLRRTLGTIAILGTFVSWVFPIWAGWAQPPEVMGSICMTGVLFAIGIATTQFAHINVLSVSDRDA